MNSYLSLIINNLLLMLVIVVFFTLIHKLISRIRLPPSEVRKADKGFRNGEGGQLEVYRSR